MHGLLNCLEIISQKVSFLTINMNDIGLSAGPGPADALDGTNVVFGKVLQGMDTVSRVTGRVSKPSFLWLAHQHELTTAHNAPHFCFLGELNAAVVLKDSFPGIFKVRVFFKHACARDL